MRRCLLLAACLPLLTGPLRAQNNDPLLAPLREARLRVWIVLPSGSSTPTRRTTANRPLLPSMLPQAPPRPIDNVVHEQTAASFGTPAGEAGQTAASYGQTPGTLGTNATDHGVGPAGQYGVTAGTFGGNATDHGAGPAGQYGQTAASFGQTAGSYGQTAPGYTNATPSGSPEYGAALGTLLTPRDPAQFLDAHVLGTLEHFHTTVSIAAVRAEDAETALNAAIRTGNAPDALLGFPLPSRWSPRGDLGRRFTLATLAEDRPTTVLERHDGETVTPLPPASVAVLRAAPTPAAARALALLLTVGEICFLCDYPPRPSQSAPIQIAARAYRSYLLGGGYGPDADEAAADFDGAFAAALAYSATTLPSDLNVQVTPTQASQNAHLAVVSLRAVVSGEGGFAVVHGIAVLRPDANHHWHVLEISSNLDSGAREATRKALDDAAFSHWKGDPTPLRPVAQAAPHDGDNRIPHPDLWWDSFGGTSLQAVEWEASDGAHWSGSQLLLVPDQNSRLRARVRADFAANNGSYRWRVWSVAGDGTLVLSPWHTFNIVH